MREEIGAEAISDTFTGGGEFSECEVEVEGEVVVLQESGLKVEGGGECTGAFGRGLDNFMVIGGIDLDGIESFWGGVGGEGERDDEVLKEWGL